MIYAGYPLYLLGGLRAILLLPMLGGVLTALGARALARRLGGRGDLAFWAVGLLTPVVIYSLDFWEHTLGLAAMLGGIVVLLDVVDGRVGWRGALVGGALFGIAATMRTEALVYAAATVLVLAWAARRHLPRRPVWCAAAAGVGVLVPLVANQLLEQAILGTGLRAARTVGAAGEGGTGVWSRVKEALTTTVGLNRYAVPTDWLLGALLAGLVSEVGGFDEQYFLYGEDLDVCRRWRAAGWCLVALPDRFAVHDGGALSGRWAARELAWWGGTMRFAARWWGRTAWRAALGAATGQWLKLTAREPRLALRAWRAPVREPRMARRSGALRPETRVAGQSTGAV